MPRLPDIKLAHMGILMVALPLAIQTGVYWKLKEDLALLHQETQELTMRRDIVHRINNMLLISFYGFESLMQLKMSGDTKQKQNFVDYVKNMTASCEGLAWLMETKAANPAMARRMRYLSHEFVESMQRSQFNPEENNQMATIYEGFQENIRFRDAARNLFWQLQELGKEEESKVIAASSKEEELRAKFERISDTTVLVDILVALGLATIFVRSTTAKLNVLKENTRRFANGIHLLERIGSKDEIGELDNVFHDMAGALTKLREQEKRMTDLLEESNERLQLVIRNVPAALVVADAAGLVESLNPSAEALFMASSAALNKKPLAKLFVKSTRLEGNFTEKLLSESVHRPLALEAISTEQEVIPVEVSACSFEGPDGPRILTTIIDITERHRLEQLKGDFYSMVSHDIRAPLTTIIGTLQLARMGKFGALSIELDGRLAVAEDNGRRLLELVNKLLDLDKLEDGSINFNKVDCPVSLLMQESAKAVMAQVEEKSITLEFVPSDLTMVADMQYIIQVLINLLSNAVKYSPDRGTVRIWCQLIDVPNSGDRQNSESHASAATKKMVEVRVSDQGPGIADDMKAAIFERFKQADQRRDRKSGFGLGLNICKTIIELHNGIIGVDSKAGKGSVFWFAVPLETSAQET